MPSANFMHRVYGIEVNKHVCSFRFYYKLRLSRLKMILALLKLMEGERNQSFPLLYQVQCSTGCCISNCIFLDGSERSEKTTLVKKIVLGLNGRPFDT